MTFNKDLRYHRLESCKEWEEWMGGSDPDQVGAVHLPGARQRDRWSRLALRRLPHGRQQRRHPERAAIGRHDRASGARQPARQGQHAGQHLARLGRQHVKPTCTATSCTASRMAARGPDVATIPAGVTEYVDREVSTGTTYQYTLLAVDTSYNRSTQSNEVEAVAEARLVTVTFNVTVPAFTPALDAVFMPGNQAVLGTWTANKLAMTQVDATHWTLTVEFLDGTAVEYKFTRGSWDTVEWWEEIHDLINRQISINYGTDGTQIVENNVPNWRDPLVVSSNPADGATGVPVDAALSVVFSRILQAEDLTADYISLKMGETNVAGAITWDEASLTLTFTPAAPLSPNTAYTLTVGPGIGGDGGSAMQSAYTVTFTTAP